MNPPFTRGSLLRLPQLDAGPACLALDDAVAWALDGETAATIRRSLAMESVGDRYALRRRPLLWIAPLPLRTDDQRRVNGRVGIP